MRLQRILANTSFERKWWTGPFPDQRLFPGRWSGQGGQILGRSSDVGMVPLPVNLATGEMDPGGVVIRPEHIHAALLAKRA